MPILGPKEISGGKELGKDIKVGIAQRIRKSFSVEAEALGRQAINNVVEIDSYIHNYTENTKSLIQRLREAKKSKLPPHDIKELKDKIKFSLDKRKELQKQKSSVQKKYLDHIDMLKKQYQKKFVKLGIGLGLGVIAIGITAFVIKKIRDMKKREKAEEELKNG